MALLNNFQVFHRPGMLLFLFIGLSKLTNANTSFSSTSVGCVLNGDDDVYGIGIRMSLYLQWAALLIAMADRVVDIWGISMAIGRANARISVISGCIVVTRCSIALEPSCMD
jgi:hypothetical protein